jgi:hypothetical protein
MLRLQGLVSFSYPIFFYNLSILQILTVFSITEAELEKNSQKAAKAKATRDSRHASMGPAAPMSTVAQDTQTVTPMTNHAGPPAYPELPLGQTPHAIFQNQPRSMLDELNDALVPYPQGAFSPMVTGHANAMLQPMLFNNGYHHGSIGSNTTPSLSMPVR